MRDTGGKQRGSGHFHVRLTKGNEEGQEDEKKKAKEDDCNMFIIKCARPQLKGKRKGEAKGRGEGESGIIVFGRSTVSFNASQSEHNESLQDLLTILSWHVLSTLMAD